MFSKKLVILLMFIVLCE